MSVSDLLIKNSFDFVAINNNQSVIEIDLLRNTADGDRWRSYAFSNKSNTMFIRGNHYIIAFVQSEILDLKKLTVKGNRYESVKQVTIDNVQSGSNYKFYITADESAQSIAFTEIALTRVPYVDNFGQQAYDNCSYTKGSIVSDSITTNYEIKLLEIKQYSTGIESASFFVDSTGITMVMPESFTGYFVIRDRPDEETRGQIGMVAHSCGGTPDLSSIFTSYFKYKSTFTIESYFLNDAD